VGVAAKHVGYVFQDATLLPWRTVQDNIALFAELDRMSASEKQRRVTEAIELVGLKGFEKHLPHELSGGMRMRTSLARSLVLDPSSVATVAPQIAASLDARKTRGSGPVGRMLLPLLVFGVIVGIWYAVSELVLNTQQRFMLPPPHEVVKVGFFDWTNFTSMM